MIDKFVKTEDPFFVRDPSSTALLNIDNIGYKQYLEERERIKQVQLLAQDVSNLKSDIGDIKQLLQQIVNGKTND